MSSAKLRQYAARDFKSINLASLLTRTNNASPRAILDTALWHATEELPTSLAHRIVDLGQLPGQLSSGNQSVDTVRSWYVKSFEELSEYSDLHSGKSGEQMETGDWEQLGKVLLRIEKRHQPVATTLAEGFHRHITTHPDLSHDDALQAFLDKFHLSRIGMRTTSSQHMTLLQQMSNTADRPGFAGIIERKMSIKEVLEKAKKDATQVCVDYYGIPDAPQVTIDIPASLQTTYIPGYLWHIAFELLKNSLRAIVETYEEDKYQPIVLSLSPDSNENEIVVQLSDLGGGIPKTGENEVWRYMYTTATSPYSPEEVEQSIQSASEQAIMAGFGYGLPISRLYGRFCGGDLRLNNRLGEGVDCFIHLPNKIHD